MCVCRGGVLVDHPPGVQAEVRGWEGASGWWPHPGQRVVWTIPGEFNQNQSLMAAHRLKLVKNTLMNLRASLCSSTCRMVTAVCTWTQLSSRRSGAWPRSAPAVKWLRVSIWHAYVTLHSTSCSFTQHRVFQASWLVEMFCGCCMVTWTSVWPSRQENTERSSAGQDSSIIWI